MRNIMPDLGATSDCLTNNRKNRGQRDLYYCFFSVIGFEFYQVWTY